MEFFCKLGEETQSRLRGSKSPTQGTFFVQILPELCSVTWPLCHMDFCTPSPSQTQMPEKLKPSSPTAKCAQNAKAKYLPKGSGMSTQNGGIRTFVEEGRCGISFLIRTGKNGFQAVSFI